MLVAGDSAVERSRIGDTFGGAGLRVDHDSHHTTLRFAKPHLMAEIRGQKLTWGEIESIRKHLLPGAPSHYMVVHHIIKTWAEAVIVRDELRKSGLTDDPRLKAGDRP